MPYQWLARHIAQKVSLAGQKKFLRGAERKGIFHCVQCSTSVCKAKKDLGPQRPEDLQAAKQCEQVGSDSAWIKRLVPTGTGSGTS